MPAGLHTRNLAHFLEVLRELVPRVHFGGYLGYRRDIPLVLKWLCETEERARALLPGGPGLTVQSHHRHPANEAIFRKLGLVTLGELKPTKKSKKGRRRAGEGDELFHGTPKRAKAAGSAKGKGKGKAGQAHHHTWHQSDLFSLLLIDQVRVPGGGQGMGLIAAVNDYGSWRDGSGCWGQALTLDWAVRG